MLGGIGTSSATNQAAVIAGTRACYNCQFKLRHGPRPSPVEVLLSSTQLETPTAHFPGRPRSQSMYTIHHDTGDYLSLDEFGTEL
jgi:hypothetical protein